MNGPAWGAVTSSVVDGKLNVVSDAGDSIGVSCITGAVKVNGFDPTTGPAACDSITSIAITGGPGANFISLQEVNETNFSTVDSVDVDAGGGTDTVFGGSLAENLSGGGDNDSVYGEFGTTTGGGDTLGGGPGNDFLDGGAGRTASTAGLASTAFFCVERRATTSSSCDPGRARSTGSPTPSR